MKRVRDYIMNTKEYAKTLRSVIDANVYTTVVMSLGSQLNDRKDRFDKADIIEQTVESASDNRLRWVDDIGRDHHDDVADLDIEFKYSSNGMITAKGKEKQVVKVKLKNSLGVNKGTTIEDPADFYMLGQENAIAIISKDDIKDYLVSVPDGIEAHIPFDSLEFIFKPEDVSVDRLVAVNYKEVKRQAQKALIEEVKQNVKH